MTEQSEEPEEFLGFGIAAYAMMTGLLTAIAQGGQRDVAVEIVQHARTWLAEEKFHNSSNFRFARQRVQAMEKIVGLLATETAGLRQ